MLTPLGIFFANPLIIHRAVKPPRLKPISRGLIAALSFACACSAQYHLETNYAKLIQRTMARICSVIRWASVAHLRRRE